MIERRRWYAVLGIFLVSSLVACSNNSGMISSQSPDQTAPVVISSPPPTADAAFRQSAEAALASSRAAGSGGAMPVPQGTPEQAGVRVWWPDELYPPEGSPAEDILLDQFDGFRQSYAYWLDIRRKRADSTGGILPTLRTAGPVAPAALPDLTLMRRSDLEMAVNEGLILPLEGWVPDDILRNLFPGTRALGEVDGVLYGVPYALNIVHTAYRTSVLEQPLLTFENVLEQAPKYAFPAGKEQGTLLNKTVLLQYLAAGGSLADQSGAPTLDEEALLAVLDYYDQGVADGIFDQTLRTYEGFENYQNSFTTGEISMACVDSWTYLHWKTSVQNIGPGPIPTLDGTPITTLDGWMWVLTTRDPDHQQQARAFLSWMMRINQQSIYTEALGILPSQQRALRLWEDETYADFAQSMITYAQVIPLSQRNTPAAMALQESVGLVLEGTSARIAADDALGRLSQ